MNFTVKYRGADGAVKTEVLDAASRADVFAQMKARGISPMSVNEGGKIARQVEASTAKPAWLKGAIAGLLVVVAAVAAWFVFMPAEKPVVKPAPKAPAPVTPKKVTPQLPPKPVVPPVETPKVEVRTNRFGKVVPRAKPETYTDDRGVLRYKKGNGRVPDPDNAKYLVQSVVHKDDHPDFKHDCENEIATLLTIAPGDFVFGDIEYNQRYREDFAKALEEPIEILPEDSEHDKAIKQQVEAVKKELGERVKAGEDIGAILQAERDEIRRLATYKSQLTELLHEQLSSGEAKTTADVDMYYQSVNKLLEEKGLEPIKMSGLMRRKLQYDLAKQREEAEKNAAAKQKADGKVESEKKGTQK